MSEEDEYLKECLKEFGSVYRTKHLSEKEKEEYWKKDEEIE